MALVTTTLSSACAQTDKSIVVASATTVAAGRFILVDQELMQVTKDYTSGTTVNVLRGLDGSAQVAHKATANVTHGVGSDFATPGAQTIVTYPAVRNTSVVSVSATSTLTLPTPGTDLRVIMNGTSVITLTVPVPTKDMDGTMLTILGNGSAAHVVTFTGGVGGAGTNYDAFTVNATGPVALVVFAANATWQMITAPAVGGTVTNIIASVA